MHNFSDYGEDYNDNITVFFENVFYSILDISQSNFQIVDSKKLSLLHLQDEINDEESQLVNMTSLGTLMFLNKQEMKNDFLQKSIEESTDSDFDLNQSNHLTLAYEKLYYIPNILIERFSISVQSLDLSHNEFSNIDFLKSFRNLTTLVMDHNNITIETEIPAMPNLQILWLNYCKITELFPWIKKLQTSCPNLRYISLMGNPCAPSYLNGGKFDEYLQYRLFVISFFPLLEHLDDAKVTKSQRNESFRMYNSIIQNLHFNNMPLSLLNSSIRNITEKAANLFIELPSAFSRVKLKNSVI